MGERLKKRRMDLGLTRTEVAFHLRVDPTTIHNWEENLTPPAVRFYPAIAEFLGESPFPPPQSSADELRHTRLLRGLSLRAMAYELGVDPDTLAQWEAARGVVSRKFAAVLDRTRRARSEH